MESLRAVGRYTLEKTTAVIQHPVIVPVRHVWNATAALEKTITYQILSALFNIALPILLGLLSSGLLAGAALLSLELLKFAAPRGLYWIGSGVDHQFRSFLKRYHFALTGKIYSFISVCFQWALWSAGLVPQIWNISSAPFKAAIGLFFGSITLMLSRYVFKSQQIQAAGYFFIRYAAFKMYDKHSQERFVPSQVQAEETVQVWRTTHGFEWMNRLIVRKQQVEDYVARNTRVERLAQVIRQEYAVVHWCRKQIPGYVLRAMELPQRWNMVLATKIEQWLLQFYAPRNPYRLVREAHFQRLHHETMCQALAVQQEKVQVAKAAMEQRRAAHFGEENESREKACTVALQAIEEAKTELETQTKRYEAAEAILEAFAKECASLSPSLFGRIKRAHLEENFPGYRHATQEKPAAEEACAVAQQALKEHTLQYETVLQTRDTALSDQYQHPHLSVSREVLETAVAEETRLQVAANTAETLFKKAMHKTPLGRKQLVFEETFEAMLAQDFDTEKAVQTKKSYQIAKTALLEQASDAYGKNIQRQSLPIECQYAQAYGHFLEQNLEYNSYAEKAIALQRAVAEERLTHLRFPTNIDSLHLVDMHYGRKKRAEETVPELLNRLVGMGYLDANSRENAAYYLMGAYENAWKNRREELAHRIDHIKYHWNRIPSIEAQEKIVAAFTAQMAALEAKGNPWKVQKIATGLALAHLKKQYATVSEAAEASDLAVHLKETEERQQVTLQKIQGAGQQQLADMRAQVEEQRREREALLQEIRNFVPVRQKKFYKIVFQVVKGQGISLAVGWLSGPAQIAVMTGQILLAMEHNRKRGHRPFRAFRMAATSVIVPVGTTVLHHIKHKQYAALCMQLAMSMIDRTAGSKGEFLKLNVTARTPQSNLSVNAL